MLNIFQFQEDTEASLYLDLYEDCSLCHVLFE